MFSSFKQKLLLGVYVFILLSIPVGAYLAQEYQTFLGSAKEKKDAKPLPKITPKPTAKSVTSPAKQLLSSSEQAVDLYNLTSPSPSSSTSPTIATSFGPTLTFKAILGGRPANNQATRMFVGIVEGNLTANPKFLLSFTVDLPQSGEYSNLSLAGLSPGSRYTALLKGSAQIATSSGFTMSPATTNLNDGQPVNLLSGDFNDDNTINNVDYSLAQRATGSTSSSANWNENIDLNKDGIINAFDLGIIAKNMGQTGASGTWTSPTPLKTATPSGSLTSPPVGSPGGEGYWIWIPK